MMSDVILMLAGSTHLEEWDGNKFVKAYCKISWIDQSGRKGTMIK